MCSVRDRGAKNAKLNGENEAQIVGRQLVIPASFTKARNAEKIFGTLLKFLYGRSHKRASKAKGMRLKGRAYHRAYVPLGAVLRPSKCARLRRIAFL